MEILIIDNIYFTNKRIKRSSAKYQGITLGQGLKGKWKKTTRAWNQRQKNKFPNYSPTVNYSCTIKFFKPVWRQPTLEMWKWSQHTKFQNKVLRGTSEAAISTNMQESALSNGRFPEHLGITNKGSLITWILMLSNS